MVQQNNAIHQNFWTFGVDGTVKFLQSFLEPLYTLTVAQCSRMSMSSGPLQSDYKVIMTFPDLVCTALDTFGGGESLCQAVRNPLHTDFPVLQMLCQDGVTLISAQHETNFFYCLPSAFSDGTIHRICDRKGNDTIRLSWPTAVFQWYPTFSKSSISFKHTRTCHTVFAIRSRHFV